MTGKLKLGQVNSKISEVKIVIQKLNNYVFELILASGELESRYRTAVNSKDITYAMHIDLIETEKKVDILMQPYKNIIATED